MLPRRESEKQSVLRKLHYPNLVVMVLWGGGGEWIEEESEILEPAVPGSKIAI